MTEDDARTWLSSRFGVSRETLIERFCAALIDESARQNLISASSMAAIWSRHVVDSAQLLPLAEASPGHWIDIGTGAGFPGMIVAILSDRDVTLIEPRRRRAAFLHHAVSLLRLENRVQVHGARAEQVTGTAAVISARAVAGLSDLFGLAEHLSTKNTLWVLPKGQRAAEEVAAARETWHGTFHVEHSITDPLSMIVTAKGVTRQ